MSISSGSLVGTSATQTGMAWSTPFSSSLAIECYITLKSGLSGSSDFSLRVTHATNSGHGYMLRFSNGSTNYDIRKVDDDFTSSQLTSGTRSTSAGDKLAIQRIGTDVNAWIYTGGAWTQFATVTDGTYTDLIYVGVAEYNGVDSYDDFGGGNPSSGSLMLPMGMLGTRRV